MSTYKFSKVENGIGPNPSVATVRAGGRGIGFMRADGTFTPAHVDYFTVKTAVEAAFKH